MHACSAARRTSRPYVVSAHGMLDSWALRQKSWRKAPYLALCERHNLASAACLRALTQQRGGRLSARRNQGRTSQLCPTE